MEIYRGTNSNYRNSIFKHPTSPAPILYAWIMFNKKKNDFLFSAQQKKIKIKKYIKIKRALLTSNENKRKKAEWIDWKKQRKNRKINIIGMKLYTYYMYTHINYTL